MQVAKLRKHQSSCTKLTLGSWVPGVDIKGLSHSLPGSGFFFRKKKSQMWKFVQLQTAVTFWLLNRFESSWYLGWLARSETFENDLYNLIFQFLSIHWVANVMWLSGKVHAVLCRGVGEGMASPFKRILIIKWVDETVYNSKEKKHERANKKMDIWRLPSVSTKVYSISYDIVQSVMSLTLCVRYWDVLIIQLKRFKQMRMYSDRVEKIILARKFVVRPNNIICDLVCSKFKIYLQY